MREPKKPPRICGDCLHVAACMAWNNGRLYDADATHCVNFQPAADVRPVVRGKWIWTVADDEYLGEYWKCNLCGEHSYIGYNYCPNCGADMRGDQDV